MSHQITPLTVAEYFAGIGLVRMGLEPLGWRVLCANDNSAKKYEMYTAFFPNARRHYIVRDIFNHIPAPPLLRTRGLSEIIEQISDSDERWWDDLEVNRHLQMMEQSHYERVAQLIRKDEIAYRTFFRRRRKEQQIEPT
jgi:site-specific DNA-cytosine methylase